MKQGVDPNPANHAVGLTYAYVDDIVEVHEGGSAQFKVWLTAQPTGDVTVTMTSNAESAVAVTLSPSGSLTFTTSAWDEDDAVTVTVTAAENDVEDDENAVVGIDLAASGGGADGATDTVWFYFIDNDDATGPNVTLSALPNPVGEGSKVTITATLSEDPSAM